MSQVNLEGELNVTHTNEPPRVVNVTVNGTKSILLAPNDSAYLYCEVDGIPTPEAYLNGSSLSRVNAFTNHSTTATYLLTEVTCKDAGRYFCYPINGHEIESARNESYVDINITCKPQLVQLPNEPDYTNQTREIRISVDKDTVFTFIIYGSRPTDMILKVEKNNVLEDLTVKPTITYTYLTPPFGEVKVTIPDANKHDSKTYILNVKNDAGTLDVRFNVVKVAAPPNDTTDNTIPIAVGVGVGGGVLLIALVVVIICVVKKRRQRLKPPTRHAAQYINPAFGNNKSNLDLDYIN